MKCSSAFAPQTLGLQLLPRAGRPRVSGAPWPRPRRGRGWWAPETPARARSPVPPGASALCPLGPVIRCLAMLPLQALHFVGLAVGKRSVISVRGAAKGQSARLPRRRVLGLRPAARAGARRAGRAATARGRLLASAPPPLLLLRRVGRGRPN